MRKTLAGQTKCQPQWKKTLTTFLFWQKFLKTNLPLGMGQRPHNKARVEPHPSEFSNLEWVQGDMSEPIRYHLRNVKANQKFHMQKSQIHTQSSQWKLAKEQDIIIIPNTFFHFIFYELLSDGLRCSYGRFVKASVVYNSYSMTEVRQMGNLNYLEWNLCFFKGRPAKHVLILHTWYQEYCERKKKKHLAPTNLVMQVCAMLPNDRSHNWKTILGAAGNWHMHMQGFGLENWNQSRC